MFPTQTVVVFKFIGMDAPPPKTLSVSSHKASQKLTLPSSQIEKARALILGDDKRFDAKKMFQLKHCLEEWYVFLSLPQAFKNILQAIRLLSAPQLVNFARYCRRTFEYDRQNNNKVSERAK